MPSLAFSELPELSLADSSRMSFPPPLRNPCKLNSKKKLDIDLIVSLLLSAF